MFLLSRRAEPARSPEAGGGAGDPLAVRHVPRAEHLARSERRHRATGARPISSPPSCKGTSPTALQYFPAFPYASYQRARPEDVRDLFAYLKTLPPVSGKARDHDLPFPFNIRRKSACGNSCSWTASRSRGMPRDSPQWNRGAYLGQRPAIATNATAAQFIGGIIATRICRRPRSGREGNRAQHHPAAARRLEREGHRLFPRDRPGGSEAATEPGEMKK